MDWISQYARELLLTFIPIFVAMDAVGTLPMLLLITQNLTPLQRNRMIRYAMITALGMGVGFIIIGTAVFSLLGITVNDFLVAGGLLLLILSVRDIVTGRFVDTPSGPDVLVGVVPLGTPMIVGPAVLTTLLLMIQQYSIAIVMISFLLNLIFAYFVFAQANRIAKWLGAGGLKATSKVASLLLAAIAVKMIRQGISGILLPK